MTTQAFFVVALAVALPVTVFVYILTTQVTPNLFVDMAAAGFVCAVVVRVISSRSSRSADVPRDRSAIRRSRSGDGGKRRHVARLRGDPMTKRWIELDQSSHRFQELHVVFRLVPSWHTWRTSWARLYDGLVFVRDTTPAVGLP